MGHRHGGDGRKNQLDHVYGGRGHPGRHPSTKRQQAYPEHPDRRGRRDRRRGCSGPCRARGCVGPRCSSTRFACVRHSLDHPSRYCPRLIGGCAVALVSFADTSVLSRVYAARTRTYVDPNQEMVGLGVANLAAGFFQGFAISSSSSRTPVAEAAGAKTQLTGVVGALAVALLLMVAPNLLQSLPNSALAAVVIASAIGLIEVADLRRIYRIQRWEFWLSIVCTIGVAVLGAIEGIGLAIVIAVIEFLWDGWRPYSAVLGQADGVKGYHDIQRYPDAQPYPRPGAVSLGCAVVFRQRRTVQ